MSPSREGLVGSEKIHDPLLDLDVEPSESESDSLIEKTDLLPRSYSPERRPRSNLVRRLHSWTCLAIVLVAGAIVAFTNRSSFGCNNHLEVPPDGLSPPWYPSPLGGTARSWADSYDKAARLVARMTLPEKVNITTGTGWMMGPSVGNTGPAVHVGFPGLALQDGPLGLRFADNSTAFPAGITVGATWNKKLMYERGAAHGLEARMKGINVLLGPCVGPIGRMPAGGRNWEGFGSDPYLQGIAGAETVKGIQSQGVMATIKHLVGNEQEHFRQSWEWGLPNAVSSNIPDRALRELYVWPFYDAVKAGVASVMCSYNQVNNSYACANSKLLNGILKDEMGFQGFVMSDWLAQRSGVGSTLAGLDMTMPGDGLYWAKGESLWGPRMTEAVLNGSVPVERLNDMVTRIVASWYQLGQDDEKLFDNKGPNFSSWTNDRYGVDAPGSSTDQDTVEVNQWIDVQGDHGRIARDVATEGIVLLKNDGILPLTESTIKSLAENEASKTRIGIFGEDAGPGKGANYCKDRGCNQGTLASGWGSGAVEFPYLVYPVDALAERFDSDVTEVSSYLTNRLPLQDKSDILRNQDVCIVFANADAGEGYLTWSHIGGDRNDLYLQVGGEELVVLVASSCGGGKGSTIVVIHAVGPVVMENWVNIPGVKAVVLANLPGQESGSSLADVLFGVINPSGKLPYTIGKSLADYGPGGEVMYRPNGVVPQQDFDEGLYIDYRYFDKQDIEPRFEFGFGLSYTKFEFSNIEVAELKAKSALPSARPTPGATPPEYGNSVPDREEALFPSAIRKLEKFVYPYLNSLDDVAPYDPSAYPYPDGYDSPAELSPAGGDEGGNPDLWVPYVRVSVDVSNVGDVAGKAVAQLYLSYPDDAEEKEGTDFPVRVLRGFEKLELAKGETRRVEFDLTRRDLSYWDTRRQNWVMLDAEYKFAVGGSSRDDAAAVGRW